jgi:hypothetical protein
MVGYIKLFRKFEKWEWFNDSQMVHLFTFLMLRATHEITRFRGYTINRGQMVFGYNATSKVTGISVRSLRTCMNRLISTGEVTRQITHDFSIVTLCNYNTYQEKEKPIITQNDTPSDNQATSQRQASDNIQECNNVRMKEKAFPHFSSETFKNTYSGFLEMRKKARKYPTEHAEELLLKKLHIYDCATATKMLENSIMNSWTGVFPLRESYGTNQPQKRDKKLMEVPS